MTEILKAIIFGIVEGVTEWLPISSTGHLILVENIVHLDASENFMNVFLFSYIFNLPVDRLDPVLF